jgi:hydroxybutyrate-dimer hydrolase
MGLVNSRVVTAAAVLALTSPAYPGPNQKPPFIKGPILVETYDGVSDDLLTGGLGKTGLQGALPGFVDPLNPTAAELRRRAIYNNYRALVDFTTNGGYGVLYGPNIDLNGQDTLGEGKIAGEEHLTFAGDASGKENVTLMVQIPASFDPLNPCIVTAPSSGSRGVYGAIGTAGDWGLKRGCAVAYTDKGTGNGAHDLQNNTVNLITGVRETAAAAGKDSNFTAKIGPAQLAAFNAATPNRFAFKHAHSEQNPEAEWGEHVLQSIEFAFFVLNDKFGDKDAPGAVTRQTITPENTIVIASSASNGGGASLQAAELDRKGLIDGVAVSEPQIQPLFEPGLTIQRGSTPVPSHSKSLLDYFTVANLFQPCAALSPANASSPGLPFVDPLVRASNRCAALHAKGLLTGATLAERANEAQAILNASGWDSESNLLHASHYAFATPAVAVTYAKAHGRARVTDNLCGFSFGATGAGGVPVAAAAVNVAGIFADGNGIPPTGGINIINNLAVGGPILDSLSVSLSTGLQDFNLDGALCLRSLVTGADPETGIPLTGVLLSHGAQVRAGIAAVRARGNLRGKPAVLVHGRADTLVPVNHSSRPYFGLNKMVEGEASRLVYYEVTNAQHFDTFIALTVPLAGYDTRFVPLHYYLIQALNLLYDHLKNGTPLPPSQVVRTLPRGGLPGAAPPISSANVPAISAAPPAADQISFSGNTVIVPD